MPSEMSGHRVLSSTPASGFCWCHPRDEVPHHMSLSVSFSSDILTICCCLVETLKMSLSDSVITIPRVLLEENHNHCWRDHAGAAGSYALL